MQLCFNRNGAQRLHFGGAAALYSSYPRIRNGQMVRNPQENLEDAGQLVGRGVHNLQQDDRQTVPEGDQRSYSKREVLLRGLQQKVIDLSCCPLNDACKTRNYMTSRYWYKRENDPDYLIACDTAMLEMSHWTTADYFDHHNNTKATFEVTRTESNKYYDLQTSIEVLEMLLNHQGQRNGFQVKTFLQDLLDVIDKVRPKCNTFMIIGPRESGKSYLIDCISTYYLNIGHMSNPSKQNNFPFNMCVNKRVLCWNEPAYPPVFEETLKKICGGDPESINVKNKNSVYMARTGLLITTNEEVLKDPIFNQRIIKYYFQTCSKLKEYTKYPTPLAWQYLIKKYELKLVSNE